MQNSRNKAWKYLKKRFGVEIENFELEKINGDYWIVPEERPELEYETQGIRFVRDMKIGLKPTTYALQFLGDRLERNVVEIDAEELRTLVDGGMIEREMTEKGYVALKFDGRVLGCGLYKDELVSSRIPKGRLKELGSIIQER